MSVLFRAASRLKILKVNKQLIREKLEGFKKFQEEWKITC
jgi:hypothetical protein